VWHDAAVDAGHYSGQAVLVTGAEGFVGGWLAERLLEAGARVVVPRRDAPAYVEDAVDAYLRIADSLDREELRGRAWNASTGQAVSVLDLVRTLTRVAGRDAEPEVRGRGTPKGEIDRQVLDPSAIRRELGWEPHFDLEEGLRRTWEWYEARLAG
jgi:CDP-glucose 4,6-dehydratase